MISYDYIIDLLTESCGIIPIIKEAKDIQYISFAYPILEIVHRSNQTAKELDLLKTSSVLLSVGTILSYEDIHMCKKQRISVVFSPHIDTHLFQYSKLQEILMIPGVSNATQIMTAYKLGAKIVKFFPCHCKDRINELKQYCQVFKHLDLYFIATGGITEELYKEILSIPKVIAVGSSSIKNITNSIDG